MNRRQACQACPASTPVGQPPSRPWQNNARTTLKARDRASRPCLTRSPASRRLLCHQNRFHNRRRDRTSLSGGPCRNRDGIADAVMTALLIAVLSLQAAAVALDLPAYRRPDDDRWNAHRRRPQEQPRGQSQRNGLSGQPTAILCVWTRTTSGTAPMPDGLLPVSTATFRTDYDAGCEEVPNARARDLLEAHQPSRRAITRLYALS